MSPNTSDGVVFVDRVLRELLVMHQQRSKLCVAEHTALCGERAKQILRDLERHATQPTARVSLREHLVLVVVVVC
jgi:hypothetical protein